MTKYIISLISLTCIFLMSCSQTRTVVENSVAEDTPTESEEASTVPDERNLPAIMVGSFNSGKQAAKDSSYYDITLHMYPIWPDEEITYLYVEQSVTAMQDRPYRQRVYKVESLEDGSFKSSVYTLPHDSLFIGKWNEPEFFESYSPGDLIERDGCAVYMERIGREHYQGSTREKECGSTLRGASYATSVVEIKPGLVKSWDQGFDADDKQVWGAVDGPYIFKSQSKY